MALKGTLQSFPPSEILQFLAYSGKTGTLFVHHKTESKLIAFEGGQLYYAVHQRELPDLRELVVHRTWASQEDLPSGESRFEWDEVVSKALERRRDQARTHDGDDQGAEPSSARASQPRLGAVMVAQRTITAEQLSQAMEPKSVPDALLSQILRGADLLSPAAIQQARQALDEGQSLYDRLVTADLVDREKLDAAIAGGDNELVADLLVYHGAVSRAEARHCLDQFERLKSRALTGVRTGRLLVAKGSISLRQLEKVREAQVRDGRLIGEVAVEQNLVTSEERDAVIAQKKTLDADFGPLSSLRRRLEAWHSVTPTEFDDALRMCWEPLAESMGISERAVLDYLADAKQIPAAEVVAMVRDILLEEVCDLLTWERASFEFFEGFSLQDALPQTPMPRLHTTNFDVQSLLLEAHSEIDELSSTGFDKLSARTVMVIRSVEGETSEQLEAEDKYAADALNVVLRCDGLRSLQEVCRVLPGSPFAHLRLCFDYVKSGLLRPLTREESYGSGQRLMAKGEHRRAAVLFRHALETPGSTPADTELREAFQNARWHGEKRLLQRGVIAVLKLWRVVMRLPAVDKGLRSVRGSGVLSKLSTPVMNVWRALPAGYRRLRSRFEQILIRQGWARHWWALKSRTITPLVKLLENRGIRNVVTVGAPAVVVLALMLQGTPEKPPESIVVPEPTAPAPVASPAVIAKYDVGAPVEVAPVYYKGHVYVSSRDGTLRALRLATAESETLWPGSDSPGETMELWALQLGEFGDILSQPVVAGEHLFVTNVRGEVVCVSLDGTERWRKSFVRLERTAPSPIHDGESGLVGLAVVSYENVHVLNPADGRALYRLRTSNRVVTQPVGAGDLLFVGSSDNHLYGVDWRRAQILWEHDAGDDVTTVHYQEDKVVFATREGRFAALKARTGKRIWSRDVERHGIRSTLPAGPGHVFLELMRGRGEEISLDTGEATDAFAMPRTYSAARLHPWDGRYFYVASEGHIGEIDRSGVQQWQTQGEVGEVTGWTFAEDCVVVSTAAGSIVALSGPVSVGGEPR